MYTNNIQSAIDFAKREARQNKNNKYVVFFVNNPNIPNATAAFCALEEFNQYRQFVSRGTKREYKLYGMIGFSNKSKEIYLTKNRQLVMNYIKNTFNKN